MQLHAASTCRFFTRRRCAIAQHNYAIDLCLSVTSGSSVKTNEWIEPIFVMEAIIGLSYSVLIGNLGIFKNNGSWFWNLVRNSELSRFSALPQINVFVEWDSGNDFYHISLSSYLSYVY